MFIRKVASALVLIATTNCAYAATIVEDINFELGVDDPAGYEMTIYKTATHNITGGLIRFEVQLATTPEFANLVFLDGDASTGSDWYRGDLGQLFSAETIAEAAFAAWNDPSPPFLGGNIEVPINQDLWFGVNTGTDFAPSGEPDRDVFGWVQLIVRDDLSIEVVDNAMAFDSGQIILGRNLLPEPVCNCLIWLSLAGLFLRRNICG